MKIYIAGGFPLMNVDGRERELINKFGSWNRLLSYFFFTIPECRHITQIFEVIDENLSSKHSTRT